MGNVDPSGLSPALSRNELQSLAADIYLQLWKGGATGASGWTPLNAGDYVAYEFNRNHGGNLSFNMGVDLPLMPIQALRDLEAELAQKLGKKLAKLAGRALLDKLHRDGAQLFSAKWGRPKNCQLWANITFVDLPKTQRFYGLISGNVGRLNWASGIPLPAGIGNPLHNFIYPFSGSVVGHPFGWIWPFTGWTVSGIAPGSWRYNGQP